MLAPYSERMPSFPGRSASGAEPIRITSAPTSAAHERRQRERRYLMSMALRMICFVGAVAVGPGWLRWVLVVGAVILPWVAVVAANAAPSRKDGFRLNEVPEQHPELGPGGNPAP